jgi:uncharacterized protein YsxB (DUF464 family)
MTLMETVVCAAITVVTIGGIAVMTTQARMMAQVAKENAAATHLLESRAEQLRNAKWSNLTSGTYIRDSLLSVTTLAASQAPLGNVIETVDMNAYPTAVTAAEVVVVRSGSTGAVTLTSAGNGTLTSGSSVRVDLTVQWTRLNNKASRTVMKSMVIANGGINGTQ